jgi:hypothetical protein
MAIDENESWGKLMQDAIAHFESTGEIQEILLPGFDQRGRWTYSFSVEGVEEALFEKLAGTKLDPVRLTNTNVSGETTLLCSFVDESEVAVAIPYHHVKGEIVIHNAGTFDAPMLLSVGERMVSICAMEFRIPKLQSVGGALEAQSAVKFNAPNLQSVGGWLCAQVAGEFHAPKLQSVGGGLDAGVAKKFHIPQLQVVEKGLDAGSALNFDAPDLQSVGGDLNAGSAVQFNAPKLESVGGDLIDYDAEDFCAPNLVSVEGSMDAGSATKLIAGKLNRVGRNLNTRMARNFYKRSLEKNGVGENWEFNPEAKKLWEAVQAAQASQPSLEI